MKFQSEDEIDQWYEEQKEKLMKQYLAERDLKKDINICDKKYSQNLKKLIGEFQRYKIELIQKKK